MSENCTEKGGGGGEKEYEKRDAIN